MMLDALYESLRPIRLRFLQELAGREAAVEAAIGSLEAGQEDDAALAEARAVLHKTVGTAATLGFPDLGTAARASEDAIDAHRAGQGPGRDALIGGMKTFLTRAAEARRDEEKTQ